MTNEQDKPAASTPTPPPETESDAPTGPQITTEAAEPPATTQAALPRHDTETRSTRSIPPPEIPTDPPEPAAVRHSRSGSAGLWLAVLDLLILIGLAGAGFLALQNFERQDFRQQQNLDNLGLTVNQLDVAKQGREQWFADIQERTRSTQRDLADLQRVQSAAQSHQEQIDRALSRLAVQVQGGQQAWQRAEIEHLLLVGNTRLQLQRDVEGARIALRLADQRLASMANPAYFEVRKRISRELTQLDAVPSIDLQALALKLSSLADQIDALAVRPPKVGVFSTEMRITGGDAELAWHQKLWVSLQEAIDGLVSVRRDVERREPLLPPDQTFYLRQNLRLQVESARLAALKLDSANYSAALRQAEGWLQRYFDAEQSSTAAALEAIRGLQPIALKPALPDISGSLNALRAVETGA